MRVAAGSLLGSTQLPSLKQSLPLKEMHSVSGSKGASKAPTPFGGYPDGGSRLLGKPGTGDGTARHGYGRDVLRYCAYRCVYCDLDLSTFEGWLQLSIDHVVPQQMTAKGYASEWVLDKVNVVACCRACNDLFNRDPAVGPIPVDLAAFIDLRDRMYRERRHRILARREAERAWFEEHVQLNLPAGDQDRCAQRPPHPPLGRSGAANEQKG